MDWLFWQKYFLQDHAQKYTSEETSNENNLILLATKWAIRIIEYVVHSAMITNWVSKATLLNLF